MSIQRRRERFHITDIISYERGRYPRFIWIVFILAELATAAALVYAICVKAGLFIILAIVQAGLMLIPFIFERLFHLQLANALIIILFSYIYFCIACGTIFNFFYLFPWWDNLLHTFSGFLFCGIGYTFFEMFEKEQSFQPSKRFRLACAISFSLAIACLWELFEYAGYQFLQRDMQHDMILHSFNSAYFTGQDADSQIFSDITSMTIVSAGKPITFPGYLDIGFIDTLTDMTVHFVGVVLFCGLAFIRGGKLIRLFIPRMAAQSAATEQLLPTG